jgi:hypothetical protein
MLVRRKSLMMALSKLGPSLTVRIAPTSAVVPKRISESLTLRMLYPAFSYERLEDIGPLG